jgi:hypothetical protein
MRRAAVAAALVLVVLLAAGCGGDDGPTPITLDGRPRYPDAEGVVERVSAESLTLDGRRTYEVSPALQSFSTSTLKTLPLLQRRGQYVQLGLDGRTVVWLANVGAPVPVDPPRVFHQGTLVRVSGGRLVFRDGTVLRLGPGVTSPVPSGLVRAAIDPGRHVVTDVGQP